MIYQQFLGKNKRHQNGVFYWLSLLRPSVSNKYQDLKIVLTFMDIQTKLVGGVNLLSHILKRGCDIIT